MANVSKKEIDSLVRRFSEELLALYREAVMGAIGGGSSSGGGRRKSSSSSEGGSSRSAPAAKSSSVGRPAKGNSAAGGRGGRRAKSSPEEVEALAEKIVDALKKAGKRLSSRELRDSVKVHGGNFNYALGKLKEDGRVKQHGERRLAKYDVGSGGGGRKKATAGAKRGTPGRKPKAAAAPADLTPISTEETPSAEG